jgi:hypothetical protein
LPTCERPRTRATWRARPAPLTPWPARPEAAKALETAARGGERDLGDLARRVEELAVVVFRSIATLRTGTHAPAAAVPAAPVDPDAIRRALVALKGALDNGDPEATAHALAALNGLQLPERVRAAVDRARTLADEYRFDEAGGEIAALLDTQQAVS